MRGLKEQEKSLTSNRRKEENVKEQNAHVNKVVFVLSVV
jgi:hypothetical protein